MFQIKAKLIYNKRVRKDYFHMVIETSRISRQAMPGQFVNIKVSNGYEPLLRRPFSIHKIGHTSHVTPHTSKNRDKREVTCDLIEILYEVVGRGTEILSQKKPGEYLDIIGPLGNGFNYRTPGYQDTMTPVLVAGGIGVAPLVFLAEKLTENKTQDTGHKAIILIGAKTRNLILCEEEFKQLGCEVKISTDDGSRGFKGKVTELLERVLATSHKPQATSFQPAACSLQPAAVLYTCGPRPMLKEIAAISKRYNIPAQISLEEHMACGFGACLGCVVNTKDGFKRVCKEGPVFNVDEIYF